MVKYHVGVLPISLTHRSRHLSHNIRLRLPREPHICYHFGTAGAVVPGNDLSLFYGNIDQLTTIHERCKLLPKELYASVVRDTVVCCVDIVLVRRNPATGQRQCLLVERASEPAKGLWWWPGGRLLKGETFFAAATRKAQQETGITNVKPIQVLGIWNTFFPTSHWDTDSIKGTQTVNPIVLVEIDETMEQDPNVKLDAQSENFKWISLNPKENAAEDPYVTQALLRLEAWDPNYMHA